jgi:hypothetical protein
MGGFVMTVGRKRFSAKSVERIVKNFESWRDSNVNSVNTIGTHWEVRKDGKRFGEVIFDGRFRPLNSTDRPPWKMVDDLLAEGFRTDHQRSPQYMAGVRAALEWRLMRSPMGCPFPAGSVEADAFVAGIERGIEIEMT